MTAAAALLAFAGAAAAYFSSSGRWQGTKPPQRIAAPLTAACFASWAASAALAVRSAGWTAGLGEFVCAAMLAGIAVCSLAPVRQKLTQALGLFAAVLAPILTWVGS